MPSCRLLPHGSYTLIPAVLSTVAWLASLAQDGCDYVRLSGPIVEEMTTSKVPYLELGFVAYREPTYFEDSEGGFWRVVYTSSCQDYDDSLEDRYWKAAKGFAFASLVLGGASSLFLWFSSCFVFSRGTWRWAGYQVGLAFLCQCLAFLWFGTDICKAPENHCGLFFGSKADIASAVLWFTSAIMIFVKYPSPQPKEEEPRQLVSPPTVEVTALPVEGDANATLQGEHVEENMTEVKAPDSELI